VIFPSSDNVHGRVRDGDLIYAALAALGDSASTKEFYERFIRDEDDQIHKIDGASPPLSNGCRSMKAGSKLDSKRSLLQCVLARST
jgi:hypothetical protein